MAHAKIAAPDGRFVKRGVSAGSKTLVVFGKGFARKLVDVDVKDGKTRMSVTSWSIAANA